MFYACKPDPAIAKIAQNIIGLAGLNDIVEILVGNSTDSIRMLKNEGKISHIDVLFIDHWEQFYLPDLMVCEDEGLLKNGAVVLEIMWICRGRRSIWNTCREVEGVRRGGLRWRRRVIGPMMKGVSLNRLRLRRC